MFDVDELIAACHAALAETLPTVAVKELLERAMSRRSDVAGAFAPITEGGINVLHNTAELTVLNVVWAPGMKLFPHNHKMWAAIGIYGGQEDNTFWRRDQAAGLLQVSGRELREGDCLVLGENAIHSVANPRRTFTGAIHVYGGDLIAAPRSQWSFDALQEQPYDGEEVRRTFEDANRAWERSRTLTAEP